MRDRRALERLYHLREVAMPQDRALVNVQTIAWSSTAGQLVVVVNVETGVLHRIWLPESAVAIGAFVVLERADNGVRVMDHIDAHTVEAAHRCEGRGHEVRASEAHPSPPPNGREESDAVTLIAEVEDYLRRR